MAGKHVSAIEEDLNIRLMQRTTRKLSLTEVGQTYYARCKRILEEYEDANREAGDAQHSIRGVLRVAAPLTFGAMHMGDVVASYLDRHPGVALEIMLNDRYVDLLAEGIDVAIRIGRLLDSDLVARRLAPLPHGDLRVSEVSGATWCLGQCGRPAPGAPAGFQ